MSISVKEILNFLLSFSVIPSGHWLQGDLQIFKTWNSSNINNTLTPNLYHAAFMVELLERIQESIWIIHFGLPTEFFLTGDGRRITHHIQTSDAISIKIENI